MDMTGIEVPSIPGIETNEALEYGAASLPQNEEVKEVESANPVEVNNQSEVVPPVLETPEVGNEDLVPKLETTKKEPVVKNLDLSIFSKYLSDENFLEGTLVNSNLFINYKNEQKMIVDDDLNSKLDEFIINFSAYLDKALKEDNILEYEDDKTYINLFSPKNFYFRRKEERVNINGFLSEEDLSKYLNNNILIEGKKNSGKTYFLYYLLSLIPKEEKILVISGDYFNIERFYPNKQIININYKDNISDYLNSNPSIIVLIKPSNDFLTINKRFFKAFKIIIEAYEDNIYNEEFTTFIINKERGEKDITYKLTLKEDKVIEDKYEKMDNKETKKEEVEKLDLDSEENKDVEVLLV